MLYKRLSSSILINYSSQWKFHYELLNSLLIYQQKTISPPQITIIVTKQVKGGLRGENSHSKLLPYCKSADYDNSILYTIFFVMY